MHLGLHFDIEAECDAETWPSDVVTGCGGDLKVLGFGRSSRRIHWSPELPGQDVSGRDAVFVIILEELGHHLTLSVNDINAGIRDSVGKCTRLNRLIQDVVGAYDLGIGV